MKKMVLIVGCIVFIPCVVWAQPELTVQHGKLVGAQIHRTFNTPVQYVVTSVEKVMTGLGYTVNRLNDNLYEMKMTPEAVEALKGKRNVPGGKVPGYMKLSPSIMIGSLIYKSDFYVVPHTLTVYIREHSNSRNKTVVYFLTRRDDGKKISRRDRNYIKRLIHYINERRIDAG